MQVENFKLLRDVQELEGRFAYLMSNTQILKNENSQPINLRIEQMEIKFIQLAEFTESLFLKNTATNDPMGGEPNLQPAKFRKQRIESNVDIAGNMQIFQDNAKISNKNKSLKALSYGDPQTKYTVFQKVQYTEKRYTKEMKSWRTSHLLSTEEI